MYEQARDLTFTAFMPSDQGRTAADALCQYGLSKHCFKVEGGLLAGTTALSQWWVPSTGDAVTPCACTQYMGNQTPAGDRVS